MKKLFRRGSAFILILALAVALCACGSKSGKDEASTSAAADLIGMQLVLDTAAEMGITDYETFYHQTASDYSQVLPSADIAIMFLSGDGHPLNYLRTNVNAQMFDEFYKTYDVKEGDGMYLPEETRVKFWGE